MPFILRTMRQLFRQQASNNLRKTLNASHKGRHGNKQWSYFSPTREEPVALLKKKKLTAPKTHSPLHTRTSNLTPTVTTISVATLFSSLFFLGHSNQVAAAETLYNQATYEKNLRRLLTEEFPLSNQLDTELLEEITEQLTWAQEHTQFTPQADVIYDGESKWQAHLHREVFRCFGRIEQLLLLRKTNLYDAQEVERSYADFTAKQPKDKRIPLRAFKQLCQDYQQFDAQQTEALIRATVIASVTMTPKALAAAKAKLGEKDFPYDSVQFSGHTVTKCPEMYPIMSENDRVNELIKDCFPADTRHWRHAYYLENANALAELQKEIERARDAGPAALGEMKQKVQFWLSYWKLNLIGFESHVEFQGSSFVNHEVYQCMESLNEAISHSIVLRDHDITADYIQRVMPRLGIKNSGNPAYDFYIFRALLMTNQLNAAAAHELDQALATNPQQQALLTLHQQVYATGKHATYVPGFLGNVYRETNSWHAVNQAMQWHLEVIANSTANITSFFPIKAPQIKLLVENDFAITPEFNAKGEVTLPKPPTPTAQPPRPA